MIIAENKRLPKICHYDGAKTQVCNKTSQIMTKHITMRPPQDALSCWSTDHSELILIQPLSSSDQEIKILDHDLVEETP